MAGNSFQVSTSNIDLLLTAGSQTIFGSSLFGLIAAALLRLPTITRFWGRYQVGSMMYCRIQQLVISMIGWIIGLWAMGWMTRKSTIVPLM